MLDEMRRQAAEVAVAAALIGFAGCPAPDSQPEKPAAATKYTRACPPGRISKVEAGPTGSAVPLPLLPLAPGNPITTPLPALGVPLYPRARQEEFRRELRYLVD